ncbi:MAG TPA: M1 family metallopeptidase [Patescibacteria group bacterium]|nr:M1 family metallopeptidase [Patescibacteria group bacterium]
MRWSRAVVPGLSASCLLASLAMSAGCGGTGDGGGSAGGGAPSNNAAPADSAAPGPAGDGARRAAQPRGNDIHSFARPDEARVTHMNLDWRIDFDERVIDGSVTLMVKGAHALHLDTRDLDIRAVKAARSATAQPALPRFADAAWRWGRKDPVLGNEMIVDLPEGADLVRIDYRTSPEAAGLQWLAPAQTAGGKHPFVYSQAEPNLARSFIPCQDSPAVRVTYEARLRVAEPLRAVMAAESRGGSPQEFAFAMTHPIAPYLIAFAAGDLVFGADGPRSGVWTEPSILGRAVDEFADMEKMLQAAERTYGPYRWNRYDILVLPPSFPYGGMENPMLTFATPTVLAGDRSLVAVVAHEMAHSWSGNLVTNATWSDFWLNEGFTTYFERRIMEEVYGRDRAEMEWMLGRQDLDVELKNLADKPADQKLRIDLTGRDPDDGFTDIPYNKGALLLRLLEDSYGRDVFDTFLRSWFDEHAFQSVTTDVFTAFLEERLLGANQPVAGRTRPDVFAWIDQPGLPADAPVFHSEALALADDAARRFGAGEVAAKDLSTQGWVYHQWRRFLNSMPDSLTPARMKDLDAAFRITATGNAEILEAWLLLAVRHDYQPASRRLEQFLTSQGRRKYLTPLYKEMVKSEAGKVRAMEIYRKARPMYQASARRILDDVVGWKPAAAPPG